MVLGRLVLGWWVGLCWLLVGLGGGVLVGLVVW